MKKKLENSEAVLAKAQEFADRGNYQAALHEFEKVSKVLERRDIQDKINTCRRELERLRRKELIKRGKRHVEKKNHRKALQCFEEAHAISADDWLTERIAGLKELLDHSDSFQAAIKAEAAGQFDKAADLYTQASGRGAKEEIIVRKACCLVRAGRERDAAVALKDLPFIAHEPERWPAIIIADQSLMYDYGFTLARTGRYYECLKAWDLIKSDDSVFLGQKEHVRKRLQANLYERLGISGGVGDSERDGHDGSDGWEAILEEGKYLQGTAGWDGGEDLISYCRLMQIERLWKEDEYEAIKKLLLPYPEQMSYPLLAIYAKAFFKLADLDKHDLSGLQLFWLSAMYDHEISLNLSPIPAQRCTVRNALIREAEELVNKYAAVGSLPAKRILAFWEVEKKLVEDLQDLFHGCSKLVGPVCTPAFAHTFGLTEHMLKLIKKGRDSFSDEESYLHVGSYYSSAASSLLYLAGGEYEKAMETLPRPQGSKASEYREFEDYGIGTVKFAYGVYLLETGKKNPEYHFKTLPSFYRKNSKYELEIISMAANSDDLYELECYEKILHNIYSKSATARIAETLSLVISRRAVLLYNADQISVRGVHRSLIHALDLDPENEVARNALSDTAYAVEMVELHEALDGHKMSRAIRIAGGSEHAEVRDAFFDFMSTIFHEIDGTDDKEEALFILNKIRTWCAGVDESHPLLDDVYGKIEFLVERE